MKQVFTLDCVHVMNDNILVEISSLYTEVTTKVSYNYLVSNSSPFSRMVEGLIQISVCSKGLSSHVAIEFEVVESLEERGQ
ncbi:MAG: hypothetical protein IJT28_07990 [Bacteroidaceae bacterium]|nr:hypothetical protein [Bacteroidaceae bacterium]